MLWYDIENYKWSTNKASNQQFIIEMIDAGIALGINAGIYTGWVAWTDIVGRTWNYAHTKGLPLWYPHYDNEPNFSDFEEFGGWTKPNIKQYMGDKTSCNVGVEYNWYP